ncbi:hypothetical protein [Pseudomonas abietaniphila]
MNIDWSKAPADATHFSPAFEDLVDLWAKTDGHTWMYRGMSSDAWHVGPQPDSKERYIERPWSGEGLPPVGTVCEFEVGKGSGDWRECEVIAIKDDHAVCWIHLNKVLTTKGACLRPIRTAEQIAADERLHEIRNALTTINSRVLFPNDLVRGNILTAAVEAMIDAGYRKQVQP